MVAPVAGKRGQYMKSRDGRTMTTSVTAGTGTAELEGEVPAPGGAELSRTLRDADGDPLVPLDRSTDGRAVHGRGRRARIGSSL
jgi:hypothetical protein